MGYRTTQSGREVNKRVTSRSRVECGVQKSGSFSGAPIADHLEMSCADSLNSSLYAFSAGLL